MRNERREPPERVAHFLTQCLFCFFAEDVGLLPERLFEKLVAKQITPDKLRGALIELFEKMQRGGLFGMEDIPWFNGGLFQKIDVPMITPMDVAALKTASTLNWSAIDVAIFGTLFERGLDPKKRSQLGAHYTDPATIMRIVTPVVERPLRAEWAEAKAKIQKVFAATKNRTDKAPASLKQPYFAFLKRLSEYRVLDPACGSGNFLYLALKTLKDIEHSVHVDAEALGLIRELDLVVSPANVLGIELNEYAAELARVTVWIGELQWRLQHGYPFKQNPVLEPLDHIECRDALLSPAPQAMQIPSPAARERAEGEGDDSAKPTLNPQSTALTPTLSRAAGEGAKQAAAQTSVKFTEALWPRADAVIGNPPFVGDKKMRAELGDEYTETLRKVYAGRVPGGADLVTYWFEKARTAIESNLLSNAGLVASNVLPVGTRNREVLQRVAETVPIYDAWRDLPWVNNGAAVRVAIVAFGNCEGQMSSLNGVDVNGISASLVAFGTNELAAIQPVALTENSGGALQGITKGGSFDVEPSFARTWLRLPNPNGKSNAEVLKRWANGESITQRNSDGWIIDFTGMSESEAKLYEQPFAYILREVKPGRDTNREPRTRANYWLFKRTGADMRSAINRLERFIVSPETPTHIVFAWQPASVVPDKNLIAIPRSDDTTMGLLGARFHLVWAREYGAPYGNHPTARRYNSSRTFLPFPFPAGLTPRDTKDQRTEVLADGAVIPAFTNPSPAARERVPDRAGEGDDLATPSSHAEVTALTPTLSRAAGEGAERASVVNDVRNHAISIARAAKRVNDLRERWLNPPEWTERVAEVIPLGMDASPYPDRILPRSNLGAADLAELKKRTLTNLYNQRPAWLADAHAALDAAVAAAYGWVDYSVATTDNEILARLLALNHERAGRA